MQTKQDMANEIVETKAIEQVSDSLYKGVSDIIDNARQEVVVYVNKHSDLMFWHIGHYINEDMGYKQYSAYGSKILATLSQRLTARYGKGFGSFKKNDNPSLFVNNAYFAVSKLGLYSK